MKTAGAIFIVISIVLGILFSVFLVGLLNTYIIMDILILYDISFIHQFNFWQVYAVIVVFNIMTVKANVETAEQESDPGETMDKAAKAILKRITGVILTWGILYLVHAIWMS
jgi:hypothetical protein